MLKNFTDKDVRTLDNATGRLWTTSMTVSMKRLLQDHQRVVDEDAGVEATGDKGKSIYFKA